MTRKGYLIEHFDGYYDNAGKDVQYPPIHPHHGGTVPAGHHANLERGLKSPPFVGGVRANNDTVPPLHASRAGREVPYTWSLPGYFTDFLDCEPTS